MAPETVATSLCGIHTDNWLQNDKHAIANAISIQFHVSANRQFCQKTPFYWSYFCWSKIYVTPFLPFFWPIDWIWWVLTLAWIDFGHYSLLFCFQCQIYFYKCLTYATNRINNIDFLLCQSRFLAMDNLSCDGIDDGRFDHSLCISRIQIGKKMFKICYLMFSYNISYVIIS